MESLKTDVLIAGAGPTGLSLAVQLMRYGIDFVIVDKKEGVTDLSKALVVHARTLEIYDQVGLAQTAVTEGEIVQNAVLMHDGRDSARLDFSDVGGHLSPFPFMLMLEQSKNERLLDGHLQSAGKAVRWRTELTSMTQSDAGVQAVLKSAEGRTQGVEARYLVGCDGASSTTRHLMGLGFEGSTFPRIFYVADVDMEFKAEPASIYATFGRETFVLLFPMQGDRRWRLIGPLPEYEEAVRANPERPLEVPYAEIENKVKTLVKRPLDIRKVNWFSTYKVHTRHAEAFSRGRCFLAGDAAHVHTPVGGQGMNTGIQDAYNLAWKLALVLKGQAQPPLLDTYNEERLANARRLLQTTDQFFEVAAGDTWYQRFFRDSILPGLAGFAWRFDAAKEFLFPTLSQIGIHYRESSLSRHGGDKDFKVKAGDRMPYFEVDGVGVYDRLRAPGFHLLAFSEGQRDDKGWAAQVEREHGVGMDFHVLPLDTRVAELFGTERPFVLLLRPDNHVALISEASSREDYDAYLQNVLGRP